MPDEPETPAKPKGHWPAGKRRNEDRGDWAVVLLSLRALLDNHGENGVLSTTTLAAALGTDRKTVWKWMHGVNRPSPEMQELVSTWIREQREKIARRSKK